MSRFASESWKSRLRRFYAELPPRPTDSRTEIKLSFLRWGMRKGLTDENVAVMYIFHVQDFPVGEELYKWLADFGVKDFGHALNQYRKKAGGLSIEEFSFNITEMRQDAQDFLLEFLEGLDDPRLNRKKSHTPKLEFERFCSEVFSQSIRDRACHDMDLADDVSDEVLLTAIEFILSNLIIEQAEVEAVHEAFTKRFSMSGSFGIALRYASRFFSRVIDYSVREWMIEYAPCK